MARNPKWTRDELILALDLYFRVNPLHTSETHPEIVKLSDILNKLPIHAKENTEDNFRNPNGVYMKLCNFLTHDPGYSGSGLKAGSKLDKLIWQEFAENKNQLANLANAIRSNFKGISRPETVDEEKADQEEEFPEGRVLTRTHKIRERSGALPSKKKKAVFDANGKLECEACGFDFKERYGKIGEGFSECHHNKPVSELLPGERTKLTDLSIVCANCHRMIHKTRPWLSVGELTSKLIKMSK